MKIKVSDTDQRGDGYISVNPECSVTNHTIPFNIVHNMNWKEVPDDQIRIDLTLSQKPETNHNGLASVTEESRFTDNVLSTTSILCSREEARLVTEALETHWNTLANNLTKLAMELLLKIAYTEMAQSEIPVVEFPTTQAYRESVDDRKLADLVNDAVEKLVKSPSSMKATPKAEPTE